MCSAVSMHDGECAASLRDLRSPVCMIMDCASPRYNEPNAWPTSAAHAGRCPDGGGQRWPPDIQTTHSTPRSNVSTWAVASERWILTFDWNYLLANCALFDHSCLEWFLCMFGVERKLICLQIMISLLASNISEGISKKRGSTARIFQSCFMSYIHLCNFTFWTYNKC